MSVRAPVKQGRNRRASRTVSTKTTPSCYKEDLEHAARTAADLIADASAKAVDAIAQAASSAAKVVSADAVQAKLLVESGSQHPRQTEDHDLLVALATKMDRVILDIKSLGDNTAVRISSLEQNKLDIKDAYPKLYKDNVESVLKDHESRIRDNEKRITQILTWGSAIVLVMGVLEVLLERYLR